MRTIKIYFRKGTDNSVIFILSLHTAVVKSEDFVISSESNGTLDVI